MESYELIYIVWTVKYSKAIKINNSLGQQHDNESMINQRLYDVFVDCDETTT